MKKNLMQLLIVIFVLTGISLTAQAGQFSSDFPQYLADHSSDGVVTGIISMSDRVDLRALQDQLYAQHADRRLWHETVVRALQEKATTSQADLLSALAALAQSGQVQKYTPLWVGNIVIVTAQPAVFEQLVTRDDILQIDPDYNIEEIQPVSRGGDEPTIAGHEIGLDRLNVPQVWAMGYTGAGRLVSHLDTGVEGSHPALTNRWRGTADPRYSGHPGWAWFDPVTNTNYPFDSGQHGTHTMGTICGRSETTYDTVGVAIDAEWISCGVIDRGGIGPTVSNALLSFQWIVDPDEDPATVWDVPDVNSNSWGVTTGHGYPNCDPTFWSVLDGCEAAGIVVVFAAGNEGPGANSLRRPADRATTDITSFSVGAVDGNNPSLPIADFSSRGPSYCTPGGTETFKPEVCAPGVNVRSSVPGGGYQGGWSGTSMATPHVAGVVALMRQANPNLTSEQVRQILLETAVDLGPVGEDNSYGVGFVDAQGAVQRALAYLQGWGTLGGIITDQASGNPIQGARISVDGRPWQASSRANGQYFLFMPADTSWNIRVEFPPSHLPVTDIVMVTENDTTIRNYALEGKVPVVLTASFGNPANVDYRSFYLKGSWNADGFYDAGWSAPQMEIKDDGVSPDQTAGDGIFTGRVLLGRDLVHTFSWAIYSENYGGEASRLQNGANFQVLTLTPPTVPTLSVNPSGSYHNWIISAFGDNGLNFDLAQTDMAHPTKWAAACSLTQGVTYNFKFRVMHSTIASYGLGGVGGANITYTPTVSAPYDFIFNDRDDSYIVQMTGTEGPPTYFHATSGLDHHVLLGWLPPGTVESQEMAYDDGQLVNAWYFYDFTNLIANMFTPSSYPVTIDSVMVHNLTDGDPYWPWPDGTHDPVGISIFLDDGSGNPLPDPAWYGEASGNPGEWVKIDVPEVLVDQGNFWVAWTNTTYGGVEGMGIDAMTDFPGNKWERFGGIWETQDRYAGDQMIRAKVFGNARDGWMAYDATPAEEISSSIPHAGNAPGATAGTSPAVSKGITNRMAYHPRVTPSEPPTILNTEVLAGYNVYRDIATGPFNRPAQTKVNSALVTATNYDDWGGLHPPIVNGTPYYYQISAVYDVGGGRFVEVGPSNEEIATPENHAPPAPFDLVGAVNNRTIHVTWSFANRDSDFAHFNVYKRLMPTGTTVLAGSPTTPVFDIVIPGGEDGIYKITVTAVDDGAPALESVPSREIYEPIGHLPPGALAATSGEEFAVPLRWMLPGSWRLGDSGNPDIPVITETNPIVPLDLSHKGETGPQNPPIITGRGGPDAFGYSWIDSDEPDGPAYQWIDITGIGTQMPMNSDDQNLGPYPVGFDVNYYGNMFNQFYVCSNGWISFTDANAYYNNQPLPNMSATPFNLIAPFWDDLYPPSGGQYWYYSDGNQLVISFIGVMHINGGGPFTFQAIIRPTGTVIFNYETLGTPTDQCTVGIQNGDGTIGLQMTFNAAYLHDALAVRLGTGPEGFQPAHYKLYRGTSPSVPLDPAHLRNGSIAGDQTSYLDFGGLVNGTTYYYKLTAVWPDSIESPSTNEASGTPANHPPSAPFNLEGTIDNRNINVHWSYANTMGDWAHFAVYKKLVPGGTWTLVGTTTDSSYVVTIPGGQDGVYQIASTAVDNGAPPLESDRSNSGTFSVGNLPPNNLVATSNRDAYVPLRWAEPGMLPTTTITYDDGTLANAYYYYDYANLHAEQFVATAPVVLDTIWVHVLTDGDAYWPWPDATHDPISVSVYADDGFGAPGDQLFYQETVGAPGEWIVVPIDGGLEIPTSNFWIAMGNLAGGGDEGIGLDAVSDFPQYKWNLFSGVWIQQDLYVGDHMIRATIVDNGRTLLLSEKAPTLELARNYQPKEADFGGIASTPGAVRSSGTPGITGLNQTRSIAQAAALYSGNGDIPRLLDTEVLYGYNIYRGTASNFPLDAAHRIRAYQAQGLSRVYNDSTVINGTTYYYKVTAIYLNNSIYEESPGSNEAVATPQLGARMQATPSQFAPNLESGVVDTSNMVISNSGGLDLNYHLVTNSGNRDIILGRRTASPQPRLASHNTVVNAEKTNLPTEPTNPPMLLGSGGPDAYGYQWIDSDEPNGPVYNWIDITDRGTLIPMTGDDQNLGPYDIGFNFNFYGNDFTTFNICSNGFISFTSLSATWGNMTLPNASAPENLLAPFWDDLHPSGGQYWFYSDGIQCVISFITVAHYGGGGPYTFQVVLDAGGSITYNYMDMGSPLNSATVGIQNSDMTIGLQVAFDQDYLHNLMSVRFSQGWLSAAPTGGLIGPGGQANINVIVDTHGLANGTYMGSIAISGWDQNNQLNPITVPVALTVGPPSGQPDIHPSITSITETLPAGGSKADTLHLENAGNANLTYSLADDRAWITLNPESGIVPPALRDTIVVNISAAMLSPGNYIGQITINSNDPDQPVIHIPVNLTVTGGGGGCQYTVGDVNGNGSFNGLDVVYSVSYFKGGALPPYSCECTPGNTWFVAGDVNSSCNFNGLDVSYMVSFFKGGPLCHPCADCMPSLDLVPGSGQPTPMILPTPTPKSKVDTNIGESGN